MPLDGPPWLSRNRFDAYVHQHDADPNCHGAVLSEFRREMERLRVFQERLIGGFWVVSAIAASGVLVTLYEILK